MLFIWLCCNGAYFYIVLKLTSSGDPQYINDGSFGPLQGFTLFLAGIVVFRVIFATIYVCKWKWRYNFDKRYAVKPFNLERAFKKIRHNEKDDEYSSDDEEMFAIAKQMYLQHEKELRDLNDEIDHGRLTEKEKLDMTIELIASKSTSRADKELADADDEEF